MVKQINYHFTVFYSLSFRTYTRMCVFAQYLKTWSLLIFQSMIDIYSANIFSFLHLFRLHFLPSTFFPFYVFSSTFSPSTFFPSTFSPSTILKILFVAPLGDLNICSIHLEKSRKVTNNWGQRSPILPTMYAKWCKITLKAAKKFNNS